MFYVFRDILDSRGVTTAQPCIADCSLGTGISSKSAYFKVGLILICEIKATRKVLILKFVLILICVSGM